MGTMTFGWEPDDWGSTEQEALAIVDQALDLGINFFDCADVYARGTSETILGKALKGRRDGVVLATKCHGRMSDTDPNARGNSRRHIIEACEASLRRLGTEWIDLYQLHRPDPDVPIDESLRALDDLIRAGKVRYIGTSTFAAWQACEALYVAKMLGTNAFVCEQPPYNLLDRRIEIELLPFCRTYDIAVIPWSPLAGGQLSGKYLGVAKESLGRARYAKSDPMNRVNPHTTKVVSRLQRIAQRAGLTLAQMCLAWVAGRPGVTSPIIGARTREQLIESANACCLKLPDSVVRAIDGVVAPGSHALDYYSARFGPNARPLV
jgi:aryl-alcohol dehydrogenase-like predicted oxidoreductase